MNTKLFAGVFGLLVLGTTAGCDDTENTGGAGGATASSGSSSTKASTTGSMTTTTTTGSMTGSSSSGTALCPVPGAVDTCQHACEALYDCAAVADCNGKDLCAGVMNDATQKMGFIGTDTGACSTTTATMCKLNADCPMGETCVGNCLVTCNNQMALKSLVDPMDCAGTVNTISSIPGGFKAFCTGMP